MLQPGAVGNWEEGAAVTLPGDVRLVLAFDGDPRPSPRPESRIDDGFDDDGPTMPGETPAATTPEAAKKAKSKSILQIVVIAICILAMAGFLLMSRGGSDTPVQNRPSFDDIVRFSLDKDDSIRTLVQKLQFAQSFLRPLGHYDYAKLCFVDLRDELMCQSDSLPPSDRQYANVIRDYVEMRLGQLQ